MTDEELKWHSSQRCMSNSQCVETAPGLDGKTVKVRDSTDPDGPILSFDLIDDWGPAMETWKGAAGAA